MTLKTLRLFYMTNFKSKYYHVKIFVKMTTRAPHISSLIILLLFLPIVGCTSGDDTDTDLEILNLQGSVKSVFEVRYLATEKFGEVVKQVERDDEPWESAKQIKFNTDGNKIEEIWYRSNRNISYRDTFIYNSNGKLSEVNKFRSSDSLSSSRVISYNEQGSISEEIYYDSYNSVSESYEYVYDENNLIIEVNRYSDDKELIEKTKYTYYNNNYLHEAYVYNEDGSLYEKIVYHYNDNAELTKLEIYDSDNELYYTHHITYDDNMNILETETKQDMSFRVSEDNKSLILDKHTITIRESFKYNNSGFIQELEIYWSDEESETFETHLFTYDQNNNWIRKVEYVDDNPEYLVIRTIEYY